MKLLLVLTALLGMAAAHRGRRGFGYGYGGSSMHHHFPTHHHHAPAHHHHHVHPEPVYIPEPTEEACMVWGEIDNCCPAVGTGSDTVIFDDEDGCYDRDGEEGFSADICLDRDMSIGDRVMLYSASNTGHAQTAIGATGTIICANAHRDNFPQEDERDLPYEAMGDVNILVLWDEQYPVHPFYRSNGDESDYDQDWHPYCDCYDEDVGLLPTNSGDTTDAAESDTDSQELDFPNASWVECSWLVPECERENVKNTCALEYEICNEDEDCCGHDDRDGLWGDGEMECRPYYGYWYNGEAEGDKDLDYNGAGFCVSTRYGFRDYAYALGYNDIPQPEFETDGQILPVP